MSTAARIALLLLVCAQQPIPTQAQGDGIPIQLQGKWRIRRIIPARTISCWGEREARRILGSEIEYSDAWFRWKSHSVANPRITSKTLTADQFHDAYSGGGAADSQVDFPQLGIAAPSVTVVTIHHPDAAITGATTEIPGDEVLLKSTNQIIFAVCNVYFEATRLPAKAH